MFLTLYCAFTLKIILKMTLSDTIDEFKLNEPPTDCIQCVKFGKHSNQYLLTASWDNTMRVYDIINNKHLLKFDHPAPVLDCVFQVFF